MVQQWHYLGYECRFLILPWIRIKNLASQVSAIAEDETLPWQSIVLMEGAKKGPVHTIVKHCRVFDMQDGKDGEELWLYIRKYDDGRIKYAVCNAPADIGLQELHHAATLRWSIEQSFQECKSFLGMADYETRSYLGWHRHMLLVFSESNKGITGKALSS